jgi:hypothetical protein
MTARPDPFKTHVADQVLAALAEAATPMSTPAIQYETGYGARYGQLVYLVLTQLAKAGDVEKITPQGVRPVYWRRLTPQVSLPPMTVCTDRDRRRPS